MHPDVIAIDGPSASGKSTISQELAARLDAVYVDSGSFYRGIAWQTLRNGRDPSSAEEVQQVLDSMQFETRIEDGRLAYTIDGDDPGDEIRKEPVALAVSDVAAMPVVREWVGAQLRNCVTHGQLVMEGRDIGTAVFPDSKFRFYLDASPEVRAQRRQRDLAKLDEQKDVAEVQAALETRDHKDSNRSISPLRMSEGACILDTSGLTIPECADIIQDKMREIDEGATSG